MKNAIQKAINFGYSPIDWKKAYPRDNFDMRWANQWFNGNYKTVLVDILFWQCLGLSLNYSRKCTMCGEYEGGHNYRHPFKCGENKWKELWHSFIDHLIEGKNVDDFFNNLTT